MDDEDFARLLAKVTERAQADADAEYEPDADDGLQIARALLRVLGRRFGLAFVLDVQREVAINAEEWSQDANPHRRADAVEIAKVAEAGYFADLIDDLADAGPSGRA